MPWNVFWISDPPQDMALGAISVQEKTHMGTPGAWRNCTLLSNALSYSNG